MSKIEKAQGNIKKLYELINWGMLLAPVNLMQPVELQSFMAILSSGVLALKKALYSIV